MTMSNQAFNVLVVDDDPDYLEIYKRAFIIGIQSCKKTGVKNSCKFNISQARHAGEAVCQVKKSIKTNRPFAIAFIDIKLSPGKDGIWAAKEIRKLDSHVEFVMVTGHAESAAKLAANEILPQHKIIFIQKPFHIREISYFACSLSSKWKNDIQLNCLINSLEKKVYEKTKDLVDKNQKLEMETRERQKAEEELKKVNEDLENQIKERTKNLEEANIALKILLEQREKDKEDFGENILIHIKQLVLPFIEKFKITPLSQNQKTLLKNIEENLNEVLSPLIGNLNEMYHDLTPTEIRVAKLVADGKTNKEIAELLGVSTGTILTHRHKLRSKLGLKNKKINLRSHLTSLL